uniref:Uncharacterized protein n=1 Tax=Caenorhabditis japonica TaxID=281687 RepID=A0A8R1IS49_CAEJA
MINVRGNMRNEKHGWLRTVNHRSSEDAEHRDPHYLQYLNNGSTKYFSFDSFSLLELFCMGRYRQLFGY